MSEATADRLLSPVPGMAFDTIILVFSAALYAGWAFGGFPFEPAVMSLALMACILSLRSN